MGEQVYIQVKTDVSRTRRTRDKRALTEPQFNMANPVSILSLALIMLKGYVHDNPCGHIHAHHRIYTFDISQRSEPTQSIPCFVTSCASPMCEYD